MTAAVLQGCTGGSGTEISPTPSISPSSQPPAEAGLPPCQLPAKIGFPAWVPNDLPLPTGTYATVSFPTDQGFARGQFVVPGSLRAFVSFILSEWPKHGWTLARGDAEGDEVDDTFSRSPAAFGALKAQEQACSPGFVLLTLGYTANRVGQSPSGNGSPLPVATNSG